MYRRAFSLLECVVTAALISIMLALLMPVLGSSRQFARSTLCGSKLKNINSALIMYDSQHGSFPAGLDQGVRRTSGHGSPGDPVFDKNGQWWFDRLETETKGIKAELWCPSRRIRDAKVRQNILCANIGVNLSICRSSAKPVSGTAVRSPQTKLLALDSGYSSIGWYHASMLQTSTGNPGQDTAYVPGMVFNSKRILRQGTQDDALGSRHIKNSLNTGYADGHAERIRGHNIATNWQDVQTKDINPAWMP